MRIDDQKQMASARQVETKHRDACARLFAFLRAQQQRHANRMRTSVVALTIVISFTALSALQIFASDYRGSERGLLIAANDSAKPKVAVEPETFDFGKVDEGAVVSHTFKVVNTGQGLLRLYKPSATCGCTTPTLSKKSLKPGETTELEVSIDTAMKQNAITKTVFVSSNDPVTPLLAVRMTMFVVNPHTGLGEKERAKIFSDAHCASCHVQNGVGKFGRDLYNADCAMCHGPKAEGESGPPLFRAYNNEAVLAHVQSVIEQGSPTNRSMPGFLEKNGGPLTEDQIVSIIDYLKALSKARKIY